jgi:hypothetical protein
VAFIVALLAGGGALVILGMPGSHHAQAVAQAGVEAKGPTGAKGTGNASAGSPLTGSGAGKASAGLTANPASGAKSSTSATHSDPGAQASVTDAPSVGAGTVGAGAVGEVPDPEASKSFPAPASFHHKAAITPNVAGEAAVAPGAPSDSEVRKELNQMRAVEHAARAANKQTFTAVPGGQSIGGNGTITPPAGIPAVVARVIAGANAITDFPYVYGGGHASFVDNAYDCSGSVSYALAAGGLLSAPETSGSLESWGAPGPGKWITVYANAGHTYMYVGGILYDTAGRSGVYASRWQVGAVDNSGYVARHWPGL